jgi:hypothetical protein
MRTDADPVGDERRLSFVTPKRSPTDALEGKRRPTLSIDPPNGGATGGVQR